MAGAVPVLEDIIKEYLIFRGFVNTLKAFEADLKADKDKNLKVERITDQLQQFITSYDINGLKDFWEHLDGRFFKKLDHGHYNNVKKLETCLLRRYIVHALQNSKPEKVTEFFEKYAAELQSQTEWKEWFVISFIRNPEQNPVYEMYFQRAWQDTFSLSLHNFLVTLFHYMPMPTLLQFDKERGKLQRLEQEVKKFKQQVAEMAEEIADLHRQKSKLMEKLEEKVRERTGTVEDEDADEFFVVNRPQSKFLQAITPKGITKMLEKNKKNKVQKQQEEQFKSKKQQFLRQPQQLHERYKSEENQMIQQHHHQQQQLEGNSDQGQDGENTAEKNQGNLHKSLSYDSTDFKQSGSNVEQDEKPLLRKSQTLPGRMRDAAPDWDELGVDETSKGGGSDDTPDPATRRDSLTKHFMYLSQEEYKEHHSAIVHCRFSASGKTIASADADGIVKVWTNIPDVKTYATIMSKSPLLSVEWAPKPDRLLLLGTGNSKVRLYDTENKKTAADIITESDYPRIVSLCCNPSGTGFVCSAMSARRPVSLGSSLRVSQTFAKYSEMTSFTGSGAPARQGILQYWDLKTRRVERRLPLEPVPVGINCAAFNHNGTLLVTGGADGRIRMFDTRAYECLIGWDAHEGEVYSIQFSADETTVYSMGSDSKFTQWSVHRMGQKSADLDIHEGAVYSEPESSSHRHKSKTYGRMFAFDAEGQYLLTGGPQSGVIYKVEKDQQLERVLNLPEQESRVDSVDWSSSVSCYTCLTGARDGGIRITSLLKL